jgi:class 3 adenylate cyclase
MLGLTMHDALRVTTEDFSGPTRRQPVAIASRLAAVSLVRTATIVFTDVVDSTTYAATLPEPGEAFTAHLTELTWHVEHVGGQVVKTMGDGLMASFPSAGAAVECAIAMQRVTREPSTDRPLSIRVGVSSGDVSVHDSDFHGLPVVEAARLCAHASGGQILIADRTRLLAPDSVPMRDAGTVQLKGLPEPTRAWEAAWMTAQTKLRAVLADDAVLVREGIARLLTSAGIDVVGQAGDPDELAELVAALHPDIAIVDVRMPPTFTTEGIELAERLVGLAPHTAVLVLTQDPQPGHAARLTAAAPRGLGYLLKERITDLHDFTDIVRRVAAGATVIDDDG